MFKLFDGYSSTIEKINRGTDQATKKILDASGATDKLNKELEATGASANTASNGLGKVVSVAALLATTIKGMNITDEFTNTTARLNLINDGLQTQLELQEKIFDSANRSKGAYSAMAGAISRMGLLASESFSGNDELIAFTELVQKTFKIGGASSTEQSSALLQLSQAMAAGRLQGDEFRSIMENAPMIADAIVKFTGKSKGELKEMSADGVITSEIIKNAMFSMSDEINSKFETMPMTFSDIWNRIKNGGTEAFASIMNSITNIINTDGFLTFINVIIGSIYLLADIINYISNLVVQYWPVIQAILIGIGVMLLVNVIGYLSVAIPILISFISLWFALNLPILAIIATIAGVVLMLQSMGVTFEDVFGFIGGLVGSVVAFIINLFVTLWNMVADFVNFLGNVFNHPLSSIQIMFSEWSSNILGFIAGIARGIENLVNKIPGVEIDITSGITDLKNKLDAEISMMKTEADWKEYAPKLDFVDYSDYATRGSDIGKGVYSDISGTLSTLTDTLTGKGNGNGKGFNFDNFGTSNNPLKVEGTGNNGKIDVDMSDEDIKYLRDIAERDYIANVASNTLAPNITVTFGDVHETADADAVAGRIKKILQEEIATASEGVY
jgi:tape measure domain-containing protein